MLMGAFFGIWGSATTGSWVSGLAIAMGVGRAHRVHLRDLRHPLPGRPDRRRNGRELPCRRHHRVPVHPDLRLERHARPVERRIDPGRPSELPRQRASSAQVFGQLNLMIWLVIALLFVIYVFVFKTSVGLRIRAVGEHPRAADTVGIDVYLTRYLCVTASGVLAAMGGAYLSIGFVHSFNENMTGGRGFIALAALIFGKWRPFGAFGAACLFGFSTALAFRSRRRMSTRPRRCFAPARSSRPSRTSSPSSRSPA